MNEPSEIILASTPEDNKYLERRARQLEYFRKYNSGRREQLRERNRADYIKNKDRYKALAKINRQKNRAKIIEYLKDWRSKNRGRMLQMHRSYYLRVAKSKRAERYRNDPAFRLRCACRTRISWALKKQCVLKSNKTTKLLGCDMDFFRDFVEHQFTNGMTWENFGQHWELDHVIPVSSFDLSIAANQFKAFHYSNCKPVLKLHNRMKSDNMPGTHQPLLV